MEGADKSTELPMAGPKKRAMFVVQLTVWSLTTPMTRVRIMPSANFIEHSCNHHKRLK